jgi:hypothetical protein
MLASMPGLTTTTVTKNLKDATYVLIGLGVVGYQRAQSRSEELAKQFDAQVTDARAQITKVRETVEGRLDALQARLPEQAKTIVSQARTAAQEAEATLRSRLTNAA